MRGGSKKCKPIPTPPRGVGLKSRPTTFAGRGKPVRGGENLYGAKRRGAGQAGWGKIAIPNYHHHHHIHQNHSTTIKTQQNPHQKIYKKTKQTQTHPSQHQHHGTTIKNPTNPKPTKPK